jgi:hypothetical protein
MNMQRRVTLGWMVLGYTLPGSAEEASTSRQTSGTSARPAIWADWQAVTAQDAGMRLAESVVYHAYVLN